MGAAVFMPNRGLHFMVPVPSTGTMVYMYIHTPPSQTMRTDPGGECGVLSHRLESLVVGGPSPVFMSKSENKCVIIIKLQTSKYSHHCKIYTTRDKQK